MTLQEALATAQFAYKLNLPERIDFLREKSETAPMDERHFWIEALEITKNGSNYP